MSTSTATPSKTDAFFALGNKAREAYTRDGYRYGASNANPGRLTRTLNGLRKKMVDMLTGYTVAEIDIDSPVLIKYKGEIVGTVTVLRPTDVDALGAVYGNVEILASSLRRKGADDYAYRSSSFPTGGSIEIPIDADEQAIAEAALCRTWLQ